MSTLHGSSLPGALEGMPFHNDNFMLSFNAIANDDGDLPYIGAVVTLNITADMTCMVADSDETDWILGVCQTSGQLQAAIDVICRGVLTVLADGAVTAGHGLKTATATVNGHVVDTGSTAAEGYTGRMIALQACGAGVGNQILAILF